jgi:hypothetical protein
MSDLARLFQEDPLKLTKDDISTIIAKYREARGNFNLGEKSAGATKKVAAKADGPKITKLDLNDLLG